MQIKCDKNNIRIDAYISEKAEISRMLAKRLFDEDLLTVNGKKVKASYKVKENDLIEYTLPEVVEISAKPQDIPIDVVYEDDDVIVVNKPVGMVVHPAPGNPDLTLVNAVMSHCSGRLSTINSVIRPGIVHRIDKDTSGLIVIAKNDDAHNFLTEQFSKHSITRIYTAVASGKFKSVEGTIDAPIGRHQSDRKRMAVTSKNSKNAVTHFTVLEELGGYSVIKCRLETGRTHQIRVHMSYIGHTLLGDYTYGDKNKEGVKYHMLHAGVLGFVHPKTKEYMEFSSNPPKEFTDIIERLRNKGL